MFKHLLLPTDGSAASESAIRQTLELARENQARVTALHVIEPFHWMSYSVEMIEDTRANYEAHMRTLAERYLKAVEGAAAELGVKVETRSVVADHPYQAIIDTAQQAGCDLIVMAKHGRRGLDALLIGSETQKVLTHTRLPVLVLH